MMKALSQSFNIVINDPFLITYQYSVKYSSLFSKYAASKVLRDGDVFDTEIMWNPFIQFLNIANFPGIFEMLSSIICDISLTL